MKKYSFSSRHAGSFFSSAVKIFILALCICISIPSVSLYAAAYPASAARKKDSTKRPATKTNYAAKATQSVHNARAAKKKSKQYAVKAAITLDVTRRKVLYEQNADSRIPPASLTKILAMFVIMDRVKNRRTSLNEQVTVSAKAAGTGGSHMGLTPGEKLPLQDLLRGMAVASGNDAAVAAAQHVAGNEAAFVRLMNHKAKQLGMRSSLFKNVHGLPAKGQQTTARDMLTMTTKYLAAHPETLTLFHKHRYLACRGNTPNTNPLLGMDGVDGLKTGYVNASGYNLITTAQRGGTRLVNVLLGAPTKDIRLHTATELVETGFLATQNQPAGNKKKSSAGTARKTWKKASGDKGRTSSGAVAKRTAPAGFAWAQTTAERLDKKAEKRTRHEKSRTVAKGRDASAS